MVCNRLPGGLSLLLFICLFWECVTSCPTVAEDPEEDVGGRLTLFLVGGVVLLMVLYSWIDGRLPLCMSSVVV